MAKALEISLSTMWSQQERFTGDPEAFAQTAKTLGFHRVEINYAMPPDVLETLGQARVLGVSSLHQPTPKVKHGGKWNYDLNLCSLDDDERETALAFALNTIDRAAEFGARAVVVHLGAVGDDMTPQERRLRQLYDSGVREGGEVEGLRADLIAWRRRESPPYFGTARRVLAALADRARARGVVVGLEDRYHYHEIPSLDETAALLAEHEPSVVGYWHDVGHAEVMHRLGLVQRERWLRELGSRTVGSHLHDVDGIGDHRAPGEGDVEWGYIAEGLPREALRVFEVNQRRSDEALRLGVALLREQGVI